MYSTKFQMVDYGPDVAVQLLASSSLVPQAFLKIFQSFTFLLEACYKNTQFVPISLVESEGKNQFDRHKSVFLQQGEHGDLARELLAQNLPCNAVTKSVPTFFFACLSHLHDSHHQPKL